ncbi:MAG: peptidoglycan DD-metalloendopeptidase family protein [Clostridiales bacterium]|nr:peptidoglycan DD-metalloendopeptidase family protein [Clostridiales bacterium]
MEQKSSINSGSIIRSSSNVINKRMVNEQGTVLNRGQVSESQKELIRNDSGSEALIHHQDDNVNQIFGNSRTDISENDYCRQAETGKSQENQLQKNFTEPSADRQEYNFSQQQSYTPYKNYSQRICYENIQGGQSEQTEQDSSAEYEDSLIHGSDPVVFGENDILPNEILSNQLQETVGKQPDYINYGIPEKPENYHEETDYSESGRSYQNQLDYTNPRGLASKQAYAEQIRESVETADRKAIKSHDNTQPVINKSGGSAVIINQSDKSTVFRQKSGDDIGALKGLPIQNTDGSDVEKTQFSKTYTSSYKKAYTSQIKKHQTETAEDIINHNDSTESVINQSGSSSVINSTDNSAVFRQKNYDINASAINGNHHSDIQKYPFTEKEQNEAKPKKSFYNREPKKNKENETSSENRHLGNEYPADSNRNDDSFSQKDGRYDNPDNMPFTYHDNNSPDSDLVNYKGRKVKTDISKFSVDNDIVEANYNDLLTKSSKDLVKNKDNKINNEQTDFSKSMQKKTVKDLIHKEKNNDVIKTADETTVIYGYENSSETHYLDGENIVSEKLSADKDIFVKENTSAYIYSAVKDYTGDNRQSAVNLSDNPDVLRQKPYKINTAADKDNNYSDNNYRNSDIQEYQLEYEQKNNPLNQDISASADSTAPFYYKEKAAKHYNKSASVREQKEHKENIQDRKNTGENYSDKDNDTGSIKLKHGLARFSVDAAKNVILEKTKNSDESVGMLIGAAGVTARILKPDKSTSLQARTTKGDFRRSNSKTGKKAENFKGFASSVRTSGKNLMKDTVKRTGTVTKNTLFEGGSAVKNSIFNAISENADNSLAINAVDKGITVVEKSSSVIKGTKSAIRTGRKSVKAVKSAPKKAVSGAKKLKAMSKRLYKFARMKRNQQIKIVGKGLIHLARVVASAVVNLIMSIIGAAASFFMPILLIALIVFVVISAITAIIPAISLKADDYELTKAWEYITEKDADTEIEYKTKYTDYPENYQCYTFVEVNKYFAVNGSEMFSETGQQYSFVGIHGSSEAYHPASGDTRINNTSLKTNADTFLIYLDAKFEDYKFDDIQADIDNFYNQIVRVQYVDNEDSPSTKMVGENLYHVFNINVNLHYEDIATYIQNNKDTIFTDKEAETYDLLYEVGSYLTKIELGTPIETEDTTIACQKRYGYYVDTDTTTKKFHSGIDITAAPGTKVLSPISGKINSVEGNKIEIYNKSDKRIITISNATGFTVSAGSNINMGDVLGTVDSNGYICLEYKVKGAFSDTYLNPAFYIDNLEYINSASSSTMVDSAINLSDYTISEELTGTARAVVEAALSMVGSTGFTNSCAKAASTIYQMAGLGYHGGNGNDFSRANKLAVSGGHVDYTQIPVGAYVGIKYGTGSAGYLYGHVAIYVGLINGVPSVVQGGSDAIAITSLDHYYEYFITNNANSVYGNDIGWNITSTGGSVSPLYFES